ncbi:MAG: AEC family transporter [Clostridiaceae bacterium]|jgi:predicted permease|nr:AEC family transporter [Clostridiaceae bacterium]
MPIMLYIFTYNILPIFILVGVGFVIARKFPIDINTLTKINLYTMVPIFTFVYLYTSTIPLELFKVLLLGVILLVINFTISSILSRILKYDRAKKYAFINSVSFYNSGNIGIPLITLVFSSPPFIVDGRTPYLDLALTAQIMMLVVQNISINSLGFFNAGRAKLSVKETIGKILQVPTIYTVPSAFLLKLVPFDLTTLPFWPALEYLRNALVAVALLTLGVQISRTRFNSLKHGVLLSVLFRLVGGPLAALALIKLLSLEGLVAQVVLISSGVPTAVNTALIAVEFDNHADFASQVVLLSTLLCTITLSGAIYAARLLFPI